MAYNDFISVDMDLHGGILIVNIKLHKVIYSIFNFPRHSESFKTNLSDDSSLKVQVVLINLLQFCNRNDSRVSNLVLWGMSRFQLHMPQDYLEPV